jgi:hypothetical protein
VLASTVYTLLAVWEKGRLAFFPVTLIAVLVAFTFRVFAVREHWPSIVPLDAPAEGPEVVPLAAPNSHSGTHR